MFIPAATPIAPITPAALVAPFARYTGEHTALSMQMQPSAQYLYQWLLQQKAAGHEQELDLHEFQTFTGLGREKPYTIKTIRLALDTLIMEGLVVITRQYNARFWKVIAYHPGQREMLQNEKTFGQNEKTFDQKSTSNPYRAVPSYRDIRETTNIVPSTHPVQEEENRGVNFDASSSPTSQSQDVEKDKERIVQASTMTVKVEQVEQQESNQAENDLIVPEEKPLDPQLKVQIEAVIAPAPMNPQIKKVVLSASLEAIQDAIAVVKQRKEVTRVKNPAGLFVKAVKEHWKPSMGKDSFNSVLKPTDEFSRWFDKARTAGVVIATQVIDGQIWVYDAQAKPVLYEQMALLHSFEPDKASTKPVLEKPSVMPLIKPPEPVDFSDVLAIIDTQLFRLKWSAERVREFLVQTYGKYSRALLADDELLDLQARLQVL